MDGPRESERSERGANRESHRARNGRLEVRYVDFLNRGVIESQVACVSHDSDDLAGKAADSHSQALADGTLLGKHVARYNVVDEEDVGGARTIARAKVASRHERDLHRFEVARHDYMARWVGVIVGQLGAPLHLHPIAFDVSSQGKVPDSSGGLDIGERPKLLEN